MVEDHYHSNKLNVTEWESLEMGASSNFVQWAKHRAILSQVTANFGLELFLKQRIPD
jgi:hypothetical protein